MLNAFKYIITQNGTMTRHFEKLCTYLPKVCVTPLPQNPQE